MNKTEINNLRVKLIHKAGIKEYLRLYQQAFTVFNYCNELDIDINKCVNTESDIEYYSNLDIDREEAILKTIEMLLSKES